jgi:hypothetical protein
MLMLFPNENSVESNDLKIAKRLGTILLEARRVAVSPRQWDSWAIHIQRLRKGGRGVAPVDEDRIAEVVEWLQTNVRNKYCPLVFSGHSFRQKFFQLEAAMLRSQEDLIEISPKSKALAVELSLRRSWSIELGLVIEKQVRFYESWCSFLKEERLTKNEKVYDFMVTRLKSTYPYVKEWMLDAWETINSFESWSGSFNYLMMSPDNRKFRKEMSKLAQAYGKSAAWVDSLFERYQEHEDRKV